MVGGLTTQSTANRALTALLLLALWVLIVVLTYRASGTNWAAGVGTALAVSVWLWSARRSYREQAQDVGPRLIVDRVGEHADKEASRLSLRRIRVANTGGRTLRRVEVTLVECSPTPTWFEPVRLQRMHGGAHPFDLPPRSEVYIELVALPHGHPEFILVHDSSVHGGLPNGIGLQPVTLTVRVTAQDLPRLSFGFEVSRSAAGRLELLATH